MHPPRNHPLQYHYQRWQTFCVNPWYHVILIVWKLGLTWEVSVHTCNHCSFVEMLRSRPVLWHHIWKKRNHYSWDQCDRWHLARCHRCGSCHPWCPYNNFLDTFQTTDSLDIFSSFLNFTLEYVRINEEKQSISAPAYLFSIHVPNL